MSLTFESQNVVLRHLFERFRNRPTFLLKNRFSSQFSESGQTVCEPINWKNSRALSPIQKKRNEFATVQSVCNLRVNSRMWLPLPFSSLSSSLTLRHKLCTNTITCFVGFRNTYAISDFVPLRHRTCSQLISQHDLNWGKNCYTINRTKLFKSELWGPSFHEWVISIYYYIETEYNLNSLTRTWDLRLWMYHLRNRHFKRRETNTA